MKTFTIILIIAVFFAQIIAFTSAECVYRVCSTDEDCAGLEQSKCSGYSNCTSSSCSLDENCKPTICTLDCRVGENGEQFGTCQFPEGTSTCPYEYKLCKKNKDCKDLSKNATCIRKKKGCHPSECNLEKNCKDTVGCTKDCRRGRLGQCYIPQKK